LNIQEDFFSLTPSSVLDSVEEVLQREEPDLRATGRALALNSLENRVYDIELDDESHIITKFYRPGRWTFEQIQEEHDFLFSLDDLEIPVVAPLLIAGESLFTQPSGIFFALFPKVKGRLRDELDKDQLLTMGRYLGRIHNLEFPFRHRLTININYWALEPLNHLLRSDFLLRDYRPRFEQIVRAIAEIAEPILKAKPAIAVHGDCHLGNTLWQQDAPFFLDFDDAVLAPTVQDLWMIVRGRDAQAVEQREKILEGYEVFRPFDRSSLGLIEPLRALRMIHYSAWIAKRWTDPSFPKVFPLFGTAKYWEEEIQSLQEILSLMDARDY